MSEVTYGKCPYAIECKEFFSLHYALDWVRASMPGNTFTYKSELVPDFFIVVSVGSEYVVGSARYVNGKWRATHR